MFAKRALPLLTLLFLGFFMRADAQPSPISRPAPEDPSRQLKTILQDLKHEVRNHEVEIRTFEDRLHNQEAAYDQLRQQAQTEMNSQKDYTRAISVNLEGKLNSSEERISTIDRATKGIITDIRQIQTQFNETILSLNQIKERLTQLEKYLEMQTKHMTSLESALHSMVDLIDSKDVPTQEVCKEMEEGVSTYKVQSGDTLKKIAIAHKISVQKIKDTNQLASDRINIGQILKIPK